MKLLPTITFFVLFMGSTLAYDYGKVIRLSLLFYEAQRSGKLPADNRINWRGDSCLDDGQEVGLDLSGGYYDAGDHVKFGFPGAAATTLLGWGLNDYKDGYEAAGEYENGLKAFKWSIDYMMKCHPSPNVFWGQVGSGTIDHSYWGRPENWPADKQRPSFKIDQNDPGSDLAGETASSFAVASMIFKTSDLAYSEKCLKHARELYTFAKTYRGKYSDSILDGFYSSADYKDELLWSAAWLYRATREDTYKDDASNFWNEFGMSVRPYDFSWNNKLAGAQVLLAKVVQEDRYRKAADAFCDYLRNDAKRTPKGLVFLSEWGSLRSIAAPAFICLVAADHGIDSADNRQFVKKQIEYMLGEGGRSYVVGFGDNPPTRPHHRASSCPGLFPTICDVDTAINQPGPNPHSLEGALVGGPDINDFYEDKRDDYQKNEVALDYNAGFQSALAGLNSLRARKIL